MSDETLSDREWAVWRSFALMSQRLTGAVEQRLQRDAGISGPDFEILRALSVASAGQARAGELGDMLSWEKSRISHHVTRMVARGLVERVNCETDARGTWIALTGGGAEALARALPAYADVLRSNFTGLLRDDDAAAFARTALAVIHATGTGSCAAEVEAIERDVAGADASARP